MAEALRDSYRCDCDGKKRTLRVLSPNDGAEQILDGIERVTGKRPMGCPWKAYEDPFVAAVLDAYPHWKERQLHLVWGAEPPLALLRGLRAYESALNAIRAHDIREQNQKRANDLAKKSSAAEMDRRIKAPRRR